MLYMFQAVSLPIIRSSKTVRQADFVIMLAAVELVNKFQFCVTTFNMKIYYFISI